MSHKPTPRNVSWRNRLARIESEVEAIDRDHPHENIGFDCRYCLLLDSLRKSINHVLDIDNLPEKE